MKIKKLTAFLLLLIVTNSLSTASPLLDSFDQAASVFKSNREFRSGRKIYFRIVQLRSQKQDQLAKQLEAELFFSFDRQFPNLNLVTASESVAEEPESGSIYLLGTYQKSEKTVDLELSALRGTSTGRVIARTEINFDIEDVRYGSMVAVLNIEATTVETEQRSAFNEIFRSTLRKSGKFYMASISHVAKISPGEVRQATGHTRDASATIAGVLLGVDRVISTSLFKFGDKKYIISSKIISTLDSRIIVERTLEHYGEFEALKDLFKKMALLLTGEIIIPATKKLAAVSQKIGTLKVMTQPEAVIYLNDQFMGITPLNINVHVDKKIEIAVVKVGYSDFRQTLNMEPDEIKVVKTNLVKTRVNLKISSNPSESLIFINGEQLLDLEGEPIKTPTVIRPVFGDYLITLKREKYEDKDLKIKINRSNMKGVNLSLKPNPGRIEINVPEKFSQSGLYFNGKYIGNMEGEPVKSFDANSLEIISLQAKQEDVASKKIEIVLEPEELKTIFLEDFQEDNVDARDEQITEINSKTYRSQKDFFIGTYMGPLSYSCNVIPVNIGAYTGDSLLTGVEYQNNCASWRGYLESNLSVYVRWFPGNSFYFLTTFASGVYTKNDDELRTDDSDYVFQVGRHFEVFHGAIGIGNQWILDSGFVIGVDWVVAGSAISWSSSSKIFTATKNGDPVPLTNIDLTSAEEELAAEEKEYFDSTLLTNALKISIGWTF